jgi:hypothetical protein
VASVMVPTMMTTAAVIPLILILNLTRLMMQGLKNLLVCQKQVQE